jgi:hypothetical protein
VTTFSTSTVSITVAGAGAAPQATEIVTKMATTAAKPMIFKRLRDCMDCPPFVSTLMGSTLKKHRS